VPYPFMFGLLHFKETELLEDGAKKAADVGKSVGCCTESRDELLYW
jgi:hypothetical protein